MFPSLAIYLADRNMFNIFPIQPVEYVKKVTDEIINRRRDGTEVGLKNLNFY